ncbi:hypothetical protein EB118_10960 [bacterium]|nr:hypothetical protein [bacterium]NDG30575.1 hypothetical protein [bacterium]
MYNNKLVRAYQMAPTYIPNSLAEKPMDVRTSLGPVDRNLANVETEGGETVFLPNKDGLPAHYKINGPRHYEGGVPMNIPPDSFVFSDTASMRIKDQEVQEEFGMPKSKKGYTPAEIAKRYDLNKYRKILQDPNSDKLQVQTAEAIIANYQVKLGKLALIQESMKGFPGGIPVVAMPFLAKYNISPEMVLPTEMPQGPQGMPMEQMPVARYGGMPLRSFQNGGGLSPEQEQQLGFLPNARQQRRMTKQAQRQAKRAYMNQLYAQILGDLFVTEKEPEIKPDTSSGVFYRTDDQGNPYYVDGNGVRITQFDKAYYGENNTPTSKDGERIIERNGKRYKIKTKTVSSFDRTKIKDKAQATQAGDIYEENGKYYKVLPYDPTKPINMSKSGSQYYTGDFEKDKVTAGEMLNRLAKDGHAVYHSEPYMVGGKERLPGWEIKASAKKALTVDEKEFLTDFLSFGNDTKQIGAGTPEFNISLQESGGTGFYGYTDPEFYEYRFWKAQNPEGKAEDWKGLDASKKLANRTTMFAALGYDLEDPFIKNNLSNPDKLYTPEFIGGKKKAKLSPGRVFKDNKTGEVIATDAGLTDAIEHYFSEEDYRPGQGDDKKLGLEHADAFTYARPTEEISDTVTEEEELINDSPEYVSGDKYTPWWLQDVVRTMGAVSDLASIKKYMPGKYQYNPYVPEPTYYDPSREIAAIQETAGIAGDVMRGSGASTSMMSARLAGIQGTAAEQIANTMGRYNTQNVGVANEFAYKKADIINQAQLQNLQAAQTYVDQVNLTNQNYDNARRAAKGALRQAYIDAVTNRAQAQVLNSLYPNYQIDPASGGMMYFNKGNNLTGEDTAGLTQADQFVSWHQKNSRYTPEQAIDIFYGKPANAGSTQAAPEQAYFNAYKGLMPQASMPYANYGMAPEQRKGGPVLPFVYRVGYM